MAETASNMLPLGSKAKDFTLIDTRSNRLVSLEIIDHPARRLLCCYLTVALT